MRPGADPELDLGPGGSGPRHGGLDPFPAASFLVFNLSALFSRRMTVARSLVAASVSLPKLGGLLLRLWVRDITEFVYF